MSRRSILISPVTTPNIKKQTRIRLPQSPERPLRIRQRLLRKEEYDPDRWWFTTHRRSGRPLADETNPLEARAVPKEQVRGTLPERIVYRFLVVKMGMREGGEFTFQSSLQGGRLELGGIVADFVFPYFRWVLQVQGPTHYEFRRAHKDDEQKFILREMGFFVHDMDLDTIQNELRFEDEMRRLFGLGGVGGGDEVYKTLDGDYTDRGYVDMLYLTESASEKVNKIWPTT